MKKAMLSQPMAGKTDEEIVVTIEVNETKCDEVHNCMCTKEVDGKTYCRGCGNVQPEQED